MIRITADTDWAATLRALLDMGRMTQVQLARAAGYSEQQISNWTRGIKTPGREAMIRLGEALGYDVALIPREAAADQCLCDDGPAIPHERTYRCRSDR